MSQHLFPTASAEESADPKKAALLLHALPPQDRAWLLDSLSAPHSETLRALLAELEELGIPADPALVAGLGMEAPPPKVDRETWVDRRDPARVAEALRGEPVGVLVQVLGMRDWTWSEAVLDSLDPVTRRQVLELGAIPREYPPQLRASLLEALHDRLRRIQAALPPPALPQAGFWNRWKWRLGR